ncbi:MAG: HD domain-containing protein [Clostridiales bacterium]|nr:HD domain-containing protein [Clostridiales bacterium]
MENANRVLCFEDIRKNDAINTYIAQADACMGAIGYTEHGFRHTTLTAMRAAELLGDLNYPERTIELTKIAGYMHDIGNVVNRADHAQSGAILAFHLLSGLNMDAGEVAQIISAIGNHDEGTGAPVSPLAAALIMADKSDVRRNRVRDAKIADDDIHDRVNYSVVKNEFRLNPETNTIELSLTIDLTYCSVMEYFTIFLVRMQMCKKAAAALGCQFKLVINDSVMYS